MSPNTTYKTMHTNENVLKPHFAQRQCLDLFGTYKDGDDVCQL